MQFVNITPHAIAIADDHGTVVLTVPPSGQVARMSVRQEALPAVGGVPVSRACYGTPEGVPAPSEGVVYLASTMLAQALKRPDVLSPDTGPTAIRKDGLVVAVRGLQAFA